MPIGLVPSVDPQRMTEWHSPTKKQIWVLVWVPQVQPQMLSWGSMVLDPLVTGWEYRKLGDEPESKEVQHTPLGCHDCQEVPHLVHLHWK